jgi:hypothetical protein
MQRSIKFNVSLAVVLLLSITLLGPAPVSRPAEGLAQADPAIERVARAHGIPAARLTIEDQEQSEFRVTGTNLVVSKILDTQTGQAYLDAVDPSGRPSDPHRAAAAEQTATANRYDKLDPSLHSQVERGPERQAIPVSIWLDIPAPQIDRPNTPGDENTAALEASLQAVEQHYSPRRQAVLDAVLRLDPSADAPRFGPVVFATLTSGQIRSIARRTDVAAIYGPSNDRDYNDDATTTERAYRAWQQGNLGRPAGSVSTTRPVIHERQGIADFNTLLNNATHPVVYWCSQTDGAHCNKGKNVADPASPGSQGHATMTAGVVGSTHPLFRGVAPNANLLLSANVQDYVNTKIVEGFEWARANGGDPTNMSWGNSCAGGAQNFNSRYVDWAIRQLFATFVIAAGNQDGACAADRFVGSPGVAWGAITVGAIRDNDNGFWSGDAISSFSQFNDPVQPAGTYTGGQMKPEVVAVGEARITTDHLGGDQLSGPVNGTSFSSPAVAGVVTLLLGRQPGQRFWPETNKAAILASSFHDIEAGTTRDGVGAVVANIADDTYRLNRFQNQP